ncbi:glycosyltransferase family A protein [Algoriphagus pacificus]|uniref:Glycosyltransferase family 2 protein n=1 Tax=Algoriphagus pacificus TaxID=2811234 RepID=A0ABS3CKE4_9BACT|nr:glycosyltransferase family A protein [Algoriphagus pacificus]MBN7817583.1 glycosyltransferase family 2 protein [Algoriphagus pacificus]
MFSVVIPIYNKKPHLERSINSVLNQSYQDFELILVDDGSTDGSKEACTQFQDPRIRIFYRDTPGPGGYAARNLGVLNSNFQWVSFLDADDNWEKDYLLNIKKAIDSYSEISIFSSGWKVKTSKGEVNCPATKTFPENEIVRISLLEFLQQSIQNSPTIWTSVVTVKKELLEKVEMFPAGKCKAGGDIDTWLRLLLKSKEMVFINKILATYQTESVNMVTKVQKSFEIGCIMKTVRSELKVSTDSKLKVLLMQFSNKYLLALIAKSIQAGKFDSSFVNWLYREPDPYKYLIVNLFKFKPVRFLYKMYLDKKEPFYG